MNRSYNRHFKIRGEGLDDFFENLMFETEADDSLTAEQSPPTKTATTHATYIADRWKGFASTPFVLASTATRPRFSVSRTIFKSSDVIEDKAGATTTNNDPSYVEVQGPPANRNATSDNPRNPTEDADSSSFFSSSITKLIETIGQQQNMMIHPAIPVFDGDWNKYRLFKMQFQNLYHRRSPDDATRLSFLTGLLSERVLKKVRDSVDCPESYDFLWKRLDAEFGHMVVEASTALNNFVNGYSLDELQIASNPTIDDTTRQSWTHLNGLNFPHVGVEDVKVLIGAHQIAA